jgi:3'-phosphoadenosine 5'-phosphosulfate sulfotransferase (PAPS reductase)/FAD synthetase
MAKKDSAQIAFSFTTATQALATKYAVSAPPEIRALLAANAPVAVGISGGKDSSAVALRLDDYLNEIGHTGPRLLIHSDLGVVEWKDSLPVCEKLAARMGWELVVVRRTAGDLMDRWEKRWSNNIERYESLACVKVILPWSTPSMRFCTSELKTDVICAELKRRFPGQEILSVTGIRHAESAQRAKMPCMQAQPRLTTKTKGTTGWNWNPIIEWPTEDVYTYLAEKQEPLHEAYTCYGCSRVSCAFCFMAGLDDLIGAATCADNHDLYRRMVELEITSTFAFQGNRWLGDVAPHLLTGDMAERLAKAKKAGELRARAEAQLADHLLYVKGWPTAVPTQEEAELIAQVRLAVSIALDITIGYTDAESIRERYAELLKINEVKQAAKDKKQKKGQPVEDDEEETQLAA